MHPIKKPISEPNAAAAIMDGVFNLVDERWFQVWGPMERILYETGLPMPKSEFVRFNFSLAALAVNFRAAFDLLPREQAERIFSHMLNFLERQLGAGAGFHAVKNAVFKYTEAFNNGIIGIRNPLHDVAMLLYYKIGLENTRQAVVDETYYVPEPRLVEFLTHALLMFSGRWEYLLERFEIQPMISATEDDAPPTLGV